MNLPHFEDGFTKSGKGLLTIFFIGIAHQLLNISFATKKISVPWFPVIEINNLSGISMVFTIFVGYSIYRYSLHNMESICECMNRSLMWGLKSMRLTRLITTTEANEQRHLGTEVLEGANPTSQNGCCYFRLHPIGTNDPQVALSLYISFNSIFSVSCFVSMSESIERQLDQLFGLLNINRLDFNRLAGSVMELPKREVGFWATFCFFLLSIVFLPLAALSNKKAFDVLLPLLSNIGLFIYLIL